MIKDWFSKLSDAFIKSENSNLGKIFSLLDEEVNQLKDSFTRIEEWRDLNNAQGKTLDFIGNDVGQKRGKTNDDVYRALIKSKIARDRSDGTFNKVIEVLAQTLNCSPSEFQLHSADEPATVYMTNAPIDTIYDAGLTPYTFTNIVQSTVSGGVKVQSIQMDGTFELSSLEDFENDPDGNNGLSSTALPSQGGTLGAYIIPDKETSVPL
ncbi:hypothetical protein ACS78_08245 [Priestia megaterium]|uniref:hypothetical protein n=1 Tax=Priestia megaterium TaxID=1404 RepID=UPI000681938F|nr:hypothetical protein [Priestia megaterium]KNH23932.1 hypothetical protein ACS78_08245 [Priestia megaterium]